MGEGERWKRVEIGKKSGLGTNLEVVRIYLTPEAMGVAEII